MNRLLIAALLLAGCGSDVSVDGVIGGLTFDLRTSYGWIDATEADFEVQEGKVVFNQREQKDLNLVLSGARFDPEQDIRFMSVEQFFEMRADEERYGLITMNISNSDSLASGAVLTDPAPDGGGDPRLNADHEFGIVRVEPDDVYPAEATIFGSRTTYTLTVDKIERGSSPYVTGTLKLAIERADSDPTTVATGTIDVEFAASLIGERVAECNASGGNEQSCELILP